MARYKDIELLDVVTWESDNEDFDKGVNFVLEKIDSLPTADMVEVVYCKSCKYNENNICIHPDNITHSYDCEENIYNHYINVYSDHFCSYGERRTDNDV